MDYLNLVFHFNVRAKSVGRECPRCGSVVRDLPDLVFGRISSGVVVFCDLEIIFVVKEVVSKASQRRHNNSRCASRRIRACSAICESIGVNADNWNNVVKAAEVFHFANLL